MRTFRLEPAWRLVLADLGLSEADVLRRAGVRADLWSSPEPSVTAEVYLALWRAVEAATGDPDCGLTIGQALRAEAFHAPIFAALCSPDLNTALDRLSRFKRLVGPFRLDVRREVATTSAAFGADGVDALPASLATTELVFQIGFARLATRHAVVPTAVTFVEGPSDPARFEAFFGVAPTRGPTWSVTFAAADAARPFLTANAAMWSCFEPELRRRLEDLDAGAPVADRVRAALVELLPSGRVGIEDAARALGVSTRSLQRRLQTEGTSYQEALDRTREGLARHYLTRTALPSAEISFLLGYEDPNSFVRAFHRWTGDPPERLRAAHRSQNVPQSDAPTLVSAPIRA